MARFVVTVSEVQPTPGVEPDPRTAGLLLADVLAKTEGAFIWDFPVPDFLRESWRQTARDIGTTALDEVAESRTIEVSLEQFRGRDPQNTRFSISFAVHYDHDEGWRAKRAVDARGYFK